MTYSGAPRAPRREVLASAVSFVAKLHGCSQPSIVMTTGGKLWVLKFKDFGGPHALMNEVVGTELMAEMGLPVPEWRPIQVSDEFLDRFPEAWFRKSDGEAMRPEAGLHFGSRLTMSAKGLPTYQVIPKSWQDRVANREDFVGALAADLWSNNCDRRQCLFLSKGQPLYARFIDHDYCLGGFKGDGVTSPRLLMMPNPQLYADVLTDCVVSKWKRRIDRLGADRIDRILEKVPPEWASAAAIVRVRRMLTTRRERLDALLEESARFVRESAVPFDLSARPAIGR